MGSSIIDYKIILLFAIILSLFVTVMYFSAQLFKQQKKDREILDSLTKEVQELLTIEEVVEFRKKLKIQRSNIKTESIKSQLSIVKSFLDGLSKGLTIEDYKS